MIYADLFKRLENIERQAESFDETVYSLDLQGQSYDGFLQDFGQLFSFLQTHGIEGSLSVKINNGEDVTPEELIELSLSNLQNWAIQLSKRFSIEKSVNGYCVVFFCREGKFKDFLIQVSPLKKQSLFNSYTPLAIIIRGFAGMVNGERLFIGSEKTEVSFAEQGKLPEHDKILEVTHFISNEDLMISPRNYLLTNGELNNSIAKEFFKKSIQTLAACLIHEYYSDNKVILKGIKRTETTLNIDDLKDSEISTKFLFDLSEAVVWVYDEKTETRLKLLIDRITLDFNSSESFIKNLYNHLSKALKQAKEQYNFVILERKDQYLKEVRELLKDLKSQSDLYATKLRSILSNWLRDVLAAFASICLTVLSKRGDFSLKDYNVNLDYILKFLALYYFVSVVIQAIVDWRDVVISRRELRYWKDVTRMYMPLDEFDRHFKAVLTSREKMSGLFYVIIVLLYIGFGILCWNYPWLIGIVNSKNPVN